MKKAAFVGGAMPAALIIISIATLANCRGTPQAVLETETETKTHQIVIENLDATELSIDTDGYLGAICIGTFGCYLNGVKDRPFDLPVTSAPIPIHSSFSQDYDDGGPSLGQITVGPDRRATITTDHFDPVDAKTIKARVTPVNVDMNGYGFSIGFDGSGQKMTDSRPRLLTGRRYSIVDYESFHATNDTQTFEGRLVIDNSGGISLEPGARESFAWDGTTLRARAYEVTIDFAGYDSPLYIGSVEYAGTEAKPRLLRNRRYLFSDQRSTNGTPGIYRLSSAPDVRLGTNELLEVGPETRRHFEVSPVDRRMRLILGMMELSAPAGTCLTKFPLVCVGRDGTPVSSTVIKGRHYRISPSNTIVNVALAGACTPTRFDVPGGVATVRCGDECGTPAHPLRNGQACGESACNSRICQAGVCVQTPGTATDPTRATCNVLHPRAECVAQDSAGKLTAVFGYRSDVSDGNVVLPIGPHNRISPAPEARGQPTVFRPGLRGSMFAVPFDGEEVSWRLGHETAVARPSSDRCPIVACGEAPGFSVGDGKCVSVASGERPLPAGTIASGATVVSGGVSAGPTRGAASVTNDGAFSYRIPIELPPGRAGLSPDLAIEYNSRNGNGPLGVGWTLDGLSEISRCNKTAAQDGIPSAISFDDSDALCLDGVRLLRVSPDGSPLQFRTETDGFTRVDVLRSDALGPLSFEVRTRDGLIHTYGGHRESRLEGPRTSASSPNTASDNFNVTVRHDQRARLSWAITETRDRYDNAIDYFYDSANATSSPVSSTPPERTLARVAYTRHTERRRAPAHVVYFRYEHRPDVRFGYVSGMRVDARLRLSTIDVWTNSTTGLDSVRSGDITPERVRTYKLDYRNDLSVSQRTLLVSVTECDGGRDRRAFDLPATAACKRPTVFTYQRGSDRFTHQSTNVGNIAPNFYISALHLADVNGDGLDDLLYRQQRVQEGRPAIDIFSDGSGNPIAGEWIYRVGHGDGTFGEAKHPPLPAGNRSSSGSHTGKVYDPGRVADLDMDGKTDFIGYENPTCRGASHCALSPTGHWKYFYSHGTDAVPFREVASEPTELATIHDRLFGDNDPPLWVADLNGDGLPEVLRPLFDQSRAQQCSDPPRYDCFQALGVRINQNGSLAPWQELRENLGNGGVNLFPFQQNRARGHWWATDVDGDGRMEFLASEPDPRRPSPGLDEPVATMPLLRALNLDNTGATRATLTTLRWRLTGDPAFDLQHYFVDVNGDGLEDDLVVVPLLGFTASRPYLALNTGNGFAEPTEALLAVTDPPLQGLDAQWRIAGNEIGANVQFVDVNQDGRQDVLLLDDGGRVETSSDPSQTRRSHPVVYLAKGEPAEVITKHPVPAAPPPLGGAPVPVVVHPFGSYFTAQRLEGVPLSAKLRHPFADAPQPTEGQSWVASFRMARVGDVDGDGLEDIVQLEADGGLHIYRRAERADLLIKVEDAVGATAEPSYAALGEASRRSQVGLQGQLEVTDPEQLDYSRSSECRYPQYCVSREVVVVKKLVLNRARFGRQTYRYSYRDGRMDVRGRGWLGFRFKRTLEVETGVSALEGFDNMTRVANAYPFAGLPIAHHLSAPVESPRRLVGRDRFIDYQLLTPFAGAYAAAPHIITEIEDDGGEFRRTTTTMSQFDTFGNPRHLLVETGKDGEPGRDRIDSSITYWNDEERWLFGFVTKQTTTSTGPNGEKETRTEEYAPDPTTGVVLTHTIEPPPLPGAARPREFLETRFDRDVYGNITSETQTTADNQKREATLVYDSANATFPIEARTPLRLTQRFSFVPAFGTIAAHEDPNGLVTTWMFDGFGRVLSEHHPTGAHLDLRYEALPHGVQTTQTRRGGGETIVATDHLGREVLRKEKGFDGAFSVVEIEREKQAPNYFVISRTRKEGTAARYYTLRLDGLKRPVENSSPDGTVRSFRYRRLTAELVDAKKQVTTLNFDQSGRLVGRTQTVDGRSIKTSNVYGPFGLLRNIVDAESNKTTLSYDRVGRRTDVDDPDSGLSHFVFNGFGELHTSTDGNNLTTTHFYDRDGRLVRIENDDGVDIFDWDAALNGVGLPSGHSRQNHGVSDGLVAATFSYTPLAQLQAARWTIRGAAFEARHGYDELGRPRDTIYPAIPGHPTRVHVRRFYNSSDGSLERVSPAANPTTFYWRADARDAFGSITHETFGNGANTVTTYDPVRDVLQRRIDTKLANGTVLQALAFDYDDNGNLFNRQDERARITETFDHDELDRLEHWTYAVAGGGQFAYRFEWSDIGNLKSKTDERGGLGSDTLTYFDRSCNAGPHAVVSSRLFGRYCYDKKGNQVEGPGRTVAYTSFNLPKSVSTTSGLTELGYDASHRRAWKREPGGSETIHVENLYERRTAGGSVSHVFHIPGGKGQAAQIETTVVDGRARTAVSYLHPEHLGTIETISNERGDVDPSALGRFKFDPWGRRIDPANPNGQLLDTRPSVRRGFSGHDHDVELDLVNMGGRIYDPRTTRFLTPDSILSDPLEPNALNRYAYALNSPLSVVDPSGHQPKGAQGMRYGGPGSGGVSVPRREGEFTLLPPTAKGGKRPGADLGRPIAPYTAPKADDNGATGPKATPPTGGPAMSRGPSSGSHPDTSPPSRPPAGHAATAPSPFAAEHGGYTGPWGMPASVPPFLQRPPVGSYAGALTLGAALGAAATVVAIESAPSVGLAIATRPGLSATAIDLGLGVGGAAAGGKVRGGASRIPQSLCFAEGTMVLMADGSKAIEEIREGDLVLARDPQEAGDAKPRRVLQVHRTATYRLFHVSIGDGGEVVATGSHPFWTQRGWVAAEYLTSDDVLTDDLGREVPIRGIGVESRDARTFNLSIEGTHTFFVLAGRTPVLVHNVDPWDVLHSQSSYGATFAEGPWAGRTLHDAAAAARALGRLPDGLTLNVMEVNNRWVALNNRTLAVARLANLPEVAINDVGPSGLNKLLQLLRGSGLVSPVENAVMRCN